MYVLELFSVAPNQVVTKDYFANFDAFEFIFTTNDPASESTEISVLGKSGSGQLIAAHRLVLDELSESVGPGVQTATSGPFFRNVDTYFIQVSVQNVTNSPQTVTILIQNWQNTCDPEEFPKFGFLCREIVNRKMGRVLSRSRMGRALGRSLPRLLRNKMITIGNLKGLNHPDTLKCSQELDKLLIKYQKIKSIHSLYP